MSLDSSNLIPCSECGRLMSKKGGVTICSRCLANQKSQPASAKKDEPPKIIITPPEKIDSDLITDDQEIIKDNKIQVKLCSICGKYHTLPGRNLCLNCTLDMYKGFKKVVEEILEEEKETNSKKNRLVYTSERRMEPFRRIRTQGLTWIKGYNLH